MGPKGSMFEGKTLDEAVRKGLDSLGMSRAEVMINVVEEGSGGFLGIGARPYKVIIMPRPGGPPRDDDDRDRDRRGGRGRREGGRDGRRGRGEGRGERNGRGRRGGEGRGGEGRGGEGRGGEGRGGEGRGGEGRGGERRGRGGERREKRREEAPAERAKPRPQAAQAPASGDDANGGEETRRRRRRGRRGGRGRRGERRRETEGAPVESAASEARAQEAPAAEPVRHEPPAGFVAVADAASTDVATDVAGAPPEAEATGVMHFEESQEPAREAAAPAETEPSPAPSDAEPAPAVPAPAAAAPAVSAPAAPERAPEPVAAAAPSASADELPLADDAKQWTEELMKAMGFEAKVSAKADGDRVDVTVEVPEQDDLLTGPKGEVRQAMQHLLNRMVNRGQGSRFHLQLEINDFWQQREDELRAMAQDLAGEALEKNEEVVTEYLNSQERRIVHMTLRDDERVKTYALGTGMIKRVAIAPVDFPEGDRADD